MGTLANAIGVLNILSTTLEAVPVVGSNLKVAAELASKICETVQNIKGNRKSYQDLALHVEQLLVAISSALQNTRKERLGAMSANVERLMKVLEEIQVAIHDRTRSDTPSPVGACGPLSNWLCNAAADVTHVAEDEDNVKEMRRKLDEVVVEFDVGAHIRTEIRVENVETMVRLAVGNISRLQDQVQANNDHAKNVEESRIKVERVAENNLLDTLTPVFSATWDAGSVKAIVCTPETRVDLLEEIMSWVGDPAGSCVFWLNGLAGTGKSTIARTLCQRLSERALLGANFFVSRQHQDRRDASNIVRTLAHQLALQKRAVADAMCSILREKPMSASRSLETQIADFIGTPAGALGESSPLVIVLDALDECLTEASLARPGGDLLLLLVRQLMGLSGRLKLFITSRAETSMQQMFDDLTTHSQHIVVKLHDLDKTVVEQDLRTYLFSAFSQIRGSRPSLDLCDWPLTEDMERVVQASGLLFVYASTVIRFVGHRQYSPRERLEQVLGRQQSGGITQPYRALDRLYTQILIDAVMDSDEDADQVDQADETNDDLCRRLQALLAVVVLIQTPLRIDALAVLSGLSRDNTHIAVGSVTALLLVDPAEPAEPVRIFHPSFPEFLTDPARCDDSRLCVQPAEQHAKLALRCLLVMNKDLRYDICDIRHPAMANADVADLETRLQDSVSDALQYACCFWPVHLTASCNSDDDPNIWDALAEFSRKHLFHWLEVLSLLQRLPMAEVQLLETIEWCEQNPRSKNMPVVARLLQDTVRVIQEYRLPLRSHALHAYHSAFVTMPQCLLLETLQQQSLPRLLPSLTSPRALHWGSWNRVIAGHEGEVLCVAVSPDGQRIVSGSKDGTVRVWSAVTLEELARLDPGKYHAASVAFSPDGARFVTISVAGIIHVWDSAAFQRLVALELNREAISQYGRAPSNVSVFCAVFSKDGTRILASAGNAMCIWSANTFEELGTMAGSAPLALSPDGTRIIACRFNAPAESAVYDATTFEELFQLEAFASDVRAIAFSPNGQQAVFGLSDNSLSVLDAATWKETVSLRSGREIASVTALSFSPCGARIICASSDGDLHLWDAAGHQELARFKGHEKSASEVAFSPDGTKIVSGSRDMTVRVWSAVDLEDSLNLENERAHRQWSRKIAFLPGGASIISRSADEPVRVWDSETLNKIGELEHMPRAGDAHVIVWSLDGSLATTLYGPHNSLRVWNTMTFEMAAELNGELDVNYSFACAALSPDNKRIVTGMRHGAVLIWDILSSEVLAELNGLSNPIRCVAYSPDGSHIAAGDELTLRIWDAATYKELHVYSSIGATTRLDFSYDGSRLVAVFFIKESQGTVCVVWSVDTFQVIAQFESDTYREPSFTADGTGILFSNLEGTTSAWMPSQQNKAAWAEVPLSEVSLPTDTTSFGTLSLLGIDFSETGWLSCWVDSTLRMIWLPHDRRSWYKAMCGRRVAIAGGPRHGAAALTGLKFPEKEGEW